jgi:hypothetical protein
MRNQFSVAENRKGSECLVDRDENPEFAALFAAYKMQRSGTLAETGDPRTLGNGVVCENYPRIQGSMRYFPMPEYEENTQ